MARGKNMMTALVVGTATLSMVAAAVAPASAQAASANYQIASQPLGQALMQLSRQANVDIVAPARLTRGRTAGAVSAESVDAALRQMLAGTGLSYKASGRRYVIQAGSGGSAGATQASPASNGGESKKSSSDEDDAASPSHDGVAEILVVGSRSQNVDIRRNEDDIQPYVVFSTDDVRSSQATNIEEFLKSRLPMNTVQTLNSQSATHQDLGGRSSINLRGLGTNQTLVLVDGRRMPGVALRGNTFAQPDINGIPLAAVERIEVLPSTASGIYGGGATGGVVNIILKRDYSGLDLQAHYGNSFRSDVASRRIDGSLGFNLNKGRTRILVAGSYSDSDPLTVGERDFTKKGRERQLRNNPSLLLEAFAPPLGQTVNIRSLGGNLTLDPTYGGTSLGSAITHVPLGYRGADSDNGAGLVANAGQFNLNLPDEYRGLRGSLVRAPRVTSVSANVRHSFSDHVEVFLDGAALFNQADSITGAIRTNATLAPDAQFNPFQQTILLTFPTPNMAYKNATKTSTYRALGGIIVRLPQNWSLEADYSWSKSVYEASFTTETLDIFGSASLGTGRSFDSRPILNAMQEANTFPIDFSPYLWPSPNTFIGPYDTLLSNASLRFSGPLARVGGGPLTLTGLIEKRRQSIEESVNQEQGHSGPPNYAYQPKFYYQPRRTQEVESAYLEVRAPLISSSNRLPFLRLLEIQAAIRRDRYRTDSLPESSYQVPARDGPFPEGLDYSSNVAASTDFTLGVRFSPIDDLVLRVSYGTGFIAPSVDQISPTRFVRNGRAYDDPKRGGALGPGVGGEGSYTYVFGGSSDLRSETSKSFSAGFIFTPSFLRGLRVSADYTRISKHNEISFVGGEYHLQNEEAFPSHVLRDPLTPEDIALGYTGGRVTLIDESLVNTAQTFVEAFDIQADYEFEIQSMGKFLLNALVTWQPAYRSRIIPSSALINSVGYSNGPLEWRGNVGIRWDKGPWSVAWNAQYFDSYLVYRTTESQASADMTVLSQGSRKIPSQTYHDVFATYDLGSGRILPKLAFSNARLSVGIQNIFDKSPPILATTGTTGGYSTYGDPRLRRYTLSLRFSL